MPVKCIWKLEYDEAMNHSPESKPVSGCKISDIYSIQLIMDKVLVIIQSFCHSELSYMSQKNLTELWFLIYIKTLVLGQRKMKPAGQNFIKRERFFHFESLCSQILYRLSHVFLEVYITCREEKKTWLEGG